MSEYITWYNIVFVLVAIGVMAYGISVGKAKEWLKWAVCMAEKELGEKTGQLKIHYVYDLFVEKFPALASVLPFSIFSKWVDLALDWMKELLEKNENVKAVIEGK